MYEFYIIREEILGNFERRLNTAANAGDKLYGEMRVVVYGNIMYYIQLMIKEIK